MDKQHSLNKKLTEVSPEYIMNVLLTSKRKLGTASVLRGTKLMHKAAINAAKRGGVKAGTKSTTDALIHLTRHPKIVKVLNYAQTGGPEGYTWPWPHHIWLK